MNFELTLIMIKQTIHMSPIWLTVYSRRQKENSYLCSYITAQWYLVHGLVQTLENVSLFAFFTKRGLSEDLGKGS